MYGIPGVGLHTARWCCIASGPSLTVEDCEAVRRAGLPTIVVNDGYRIAPWADVLYACDGKWWAHHYDLVRAIFRGRRCTARHEDAGNDAAPEYGLVRIPGKTAPGLGNDCLHYGNNSGYQAINLAYLLGAREVLLLGYDMGVPPGGKSHWFGDHPPALQEASGFDAFINSYNQMNPEAHGLRVINCSRATALDCFPRQPLEQALGTP